MHHPELLRRAKRKVAIDWPPKQESIAGVELGGKLADLYEAIRLSTEKAVRQAHSNKGMAGSQIQTLDPLLKLRQVRCDPRLVPCQLRPVPGAPASREKGSSNRPSWNC